MLLLQGLREEWGTREAELKAQIEKLRAEKKDLEAKSGGVNLKQIQVNQPINTIPPHAFARFTAMMLENMETEAQHAP